MSALGSILKTLSKIRAPKPASQAMVKYDPNFAKMQAIKAANASKAPSFLPDRSSIASGAASMAGMGLMMGIPIAVAAGQGAYDPPPADRPEEDQEPVTAPPAKFAKGGRIDGCALRGKTKGRIL